MKIAICGILGKMGKEIVNVAYEKGVKICAGIERKEFEGKSSKEFFPFIPYEFSIISSEEALKKIHEREKIDVIIDFSHRGVITPYLKFVYENKIDIGFVIGTTGFSDEEIDFIKKCSESIPIFFSYNMSRGINLLLKKILPEIKKSLPDFDVEIVEIHHKLKKDAPSGTALKLAEVLGGQKIFGRSGIVGPRPENELGIFAVRGGDVVGDHIIFFLGDGERIEIVHRASSRRVFAVGAIKAAEIVFERKEKGQKGLITSFFE